MPSTETATVYLDCETGGLRVRDRPWEIGAVRVDPDGSESLHVFHVADFQPSEADPAALAMAGFYDRHPVHALDEFAAGVAAAGPDLDVVVEHRVEPEVLVAFRLERLIRGAVVACANPSFDVRVLAGMLDRAGRAWTAHYKAVCVYDLAAGALGVRQPIHSGDLVAMLGVVRDPGTAHTALADALYARDVDRAARAHVEAAR